VEHGAAVAELLDVPVKEVNEILGFKTKNPNLP